MPDAPRPTLATWIKAVRVYQWSKNLLVFAALVFAQQIGEPMQVLRCIAAFIVYCAISSAVYVFNDINDVEKDRAHPEKKSRPFASGALSIQTGWRLLIGLVIGGAAGAIALGYQFAAILALYAVLNLGYTLFIKHVPILDVMVVAMGFVLRAIAGAAVIGVEFTNWLVVCTLFLALFLALGKRRRELIALEDGAGSHRRVLEHYSVPYLESLILIMATATLLVYVIYTCTPEVIQRLGTDDLYLTIPFVVYGLFRYLYLVHHKDGGGDPSRALLQDVPLLAAVLLWGLASAVILYSEEVGGMLQRMYAGM